MLLCLEALFAVLFASGAALVYLPAGLMVAGLLGVLACEWESARRRADTGPARAP